MSGVMINGNTPLRTWVGIALLSYVFTGIDLIISIILSFVYGLNSAR